jgi:alpha-1,2-mannosyltransferase
VTAVATASRIRPAPPRRLRPLLAVLCGLVIAVVLAVVERARLGNGPFTTTDLQVFWRSGLAVRTGRDPYLFWLPQAHLSLVYPPIAGLLLAPLSLLPLDALRLVWLTGIFAALQALLWRSTGWVGMRSGWPRLVVSLTAPAALLIFDPVRQELWSGQVNTFLALLVLADLGRRDGARGRGVAIGLATGIKLVPGLFIVYFLLTRRFREAAVAMATFAATVLVGALALPGPAWRYWTSYAWDADRVYPHPYIIYNQNLRGAIARLLHRDDVTLPWALAAVLVTAAGLAVCVGLYRRGLDREGAALCGVVALLVSPISWVYHWVWLVPVLVVLLAGAWRAAIRRPDGRWLGGWARAGGGWWAALAVVTAVVPVLHPYTWIGGYADQPSGPAQQIISNALVLLGLVLLFAGTLLWWSRQTRGELVPAEAPEPVPTGPPVLR